MNRDFNSRGTLFLLLFLAINPGVFLWVIGTVLFPGGWRLGFIFSATCILSLIPVLSFKGKYKITYTAKGLDDKMYILGLYEYIRVAEKDKIVFDADPEHTLAIAEKLLPYAMVFGMETKWIAYLESMLDLSGLDTERYTHHESLITNYAFATTYAHSVYSSTMSTHSASTSSSFSSSGSSGSFSGSSGGGGGGGGVSSW